MRFPLFRSTIRGDRPGLGGIWVVEAGFAGSCASSNGSCPADPGRQAEGGGAADDCSCFPIVLVRRDATSPAWNPGDGIRVEHDGMIGMLGKREGQGGG